ncbi:3-O-alpha-D-mannopyranosyl-alpha-D-mannopyranose xylosylphosphotransferase OS=Cryptococcus gattii serotype B (strain WM276 / ATCC MYA-4071) GN=XPT1 PE=3 SV=1 [Rhizoctonia solani AG-1 IB]|uniref:3-O-alpha-D-mannopyranosyl-alpha-D-mannopyranose xylosylphosphotransferase n=1 Tax=Thanatephorus cucumeris (strain AG1-IB / isolate 7/3/14) TaxID=1108050 RepID=M5BMH7_THACB|nr:Exopolysaccharide phosphotransferase SCO2592 [Rhizoctonia solani AG-1 IB]CEL51931.1 3-O-alpha-D-mannopyranosyl-alpha-D-mannopyranose xylosylphosphotransferase OS=Cryptococcus gattii serotype B (strain WM276 / ATCC MYA-4071) GN=XPT1 PE=3 SV=1 [Rhizoctonia solani AG-1 IB]
MRVLDFIAIVNSRLLTFLLLFNVSFISILFLSSDFPQTIGNLLEQHFAQDQLLDEAEINSLIASNTERPLTYEPSPEWLIAALNDDNLPCQSLPPPISGQEHGYSYPPPSIQNIQSKYLPFQHQPDNLPRPKLDSDLDIADVCVESAITEGNLCVAHAVSNPKLDVVWTFANGSGVLHEKWRKVRQVQQRLQRTGTLAPRAARATTRQVTAGTEKKLFRDHDELRHSMRSVLQHFRPHTSQFHLLTSDFAFPSCNPDDHAGWRLGQIPQWLSLDNAYKWKDGGVHLSVVPHAKFFGESYRYTTFNSLAIESQFGHLNVSDAFIYLNDDFYFSADLSPWDFYTQSYGLVLRMQSDLLVSSLVDGAQPSGGEWHSLEFSNRLLSDRFGLRKRPYVIHEAKALKRSLINEISLIWSAELAETASHPFRTDPLLRDAHMGFMSAHFVVERWREGLLWSWIIAKLGGKGDEWDAVTSVQAWRELGGNHTTPDMTLIVDTPSRDSLSSERLAEAQAAVPGAHIKHSTEYSFTSQDGYPYTFLGDYGMGHWPRFPTQYMHCAIVFSKCFPTELSSASDMFKHVAFKEPQCGDCIIQALVGASGRLGLSAFLPPMTHGAKNIEALKQGVIPHLPLVSDYRTGDFSLKAVVGDSTADVRLWTAKMLQRYRFVIGDTPSVFAMVKSASDAEVTFKSIKADPSIALLCLNDDIRGGEAEAADKSLRHEQEKRWPHAAAWEIR